MGNQCNKKSLWIYSLSLMGILAFTSNSFAQSGGGGTNSGGGARSSNQTSGNIGPTVPNRTTSNIGPASPASVDQIFSPRFYLNGGDYAGAQIISVAVRAAPDALTNEILDDLLGTRNDRNFTRTQLYTDLSNQLGAQGNIYASSQTRVPIMSNTGTHNGILFQPLPSNPPANAPSRPISRVEDAQTQEIRQLINVFQQNVTTSQVLLAAAQETGNSHFRDQALEILASSRRQLVDAQNTLAISESYRGRAFANDTDAHRYIQSRDDTSSGARGATRSTVTAASNLFSEMRSAYGNILSSGGADPISPNTRERLEVAINSSDAASRRLEIRSVSLEAAAAAGERAYYGDNIVLLPTVNQLQPRNPVNNEPIRHTLTELPGPNQSNNRPNTNNNSNNPNSNRSNNNSNNTQANNAPNNGSNNTPNAPIPAPVVMPRQPTDSVPYPTYNGPSQAQIDRNHTAAQTQARQVDPNSQTGQIITTAQVPNTNGDDNLTAVDTSITDATTGGHVEVTPYSAVDGALVSVEAARQAAADAAAARAVQGNARNLATNAVNTAIAATRQVTGGGVFQQARLASIYQGYNINGGSPTGTIRSTTPSSAGTSLSAAGYSLSAAGISLTNVMRLNSAAGSVGFSYAGVGGVSSATNGFSLVTQGLSLATYGFSLAGGPFVAGNLGLDDPAMRGLGANDINNPWAFAPAPRNSDIAAATLRGPFQLQNDTNGRRGLESGGILVGNLLDDQSRNLNELVNNGVGGLNALLAQPFNVVLTWGADAYDIDLHMTGPSGEGSSDRFHIYYAARGSQTQFPFAELIKDCICSNGSEVILTSQLVRGGVYRISAFNYGNQSTTSTNLSDMSNAEIYIVRGGVATAQGNGTTITGGRVIYRGKVPRGRPGNTWTAVEINAKNGRITAPNIVGNSGGSSGVQ